MRIVEQHSHLNGWEHIMVHKPDIWAQIEEVIATVDAQNTRDKKSIEKGMLDEPVYSPAHLNNQFWGELSARGWHEPSTQTNFIKDRIAVEVQFGVYSFGPYDLFGRHMASYVSDVIDVGVEVLPMKVMSSEMSSGISFYEGELSNVIQQGRGIPAVPLVIG